LTGGALIAAVTEPKIPHATWADRRLPVAVAALAGGLLLDLAVTGYDLRHFEELFYGGDSMNGALAEIAGRGADYARFLLWPVAVLVMARGAVRAARGDRNGRSTVVTGAAVFLLCCGFYSVTGGPNDGADRHRLGVIHDANEPLWVHLVDIVVPLSVMGAAMASIVLVVLAWRDDPD
jgi:hypothetical protein